MFYLAFENISRRFKMFWFTALICIISFILAGISAYILALNKSSTNSINDDGTNVEDIGYLNYTVPTLDDDGFYESLEEFQADVDLGAELRNKLYNLKEVAAIGSYDCAVYTYSTDKEKWDAIGIEQTENGRIGYDTQGSVADTDVERFTIDYTLMGMKELKVSEGTKISEAEKLFEEYDSIMYIGANVQAAYIGEILEKPYYNENSKKIYVAGRLAEGESWYNPRLYSENGLLENREMVNLDNMIIEIQSPAAQDYGNCRFFINAEGYSLEEARNAILEVLAGESITNVETGTVSDILVARYENEDKTIYDFAIPISIIMMITAIIILICIIMATLVLRNREFGIFYSVGYTKKQIVGSIYVENLIKCLFSAVIAAGILYLILNILYSVNDSVQTREVFHKLYFKYTLPCILLSSVFTSLIASILPGTIMHKKKPVDFMDNRF